MIGPMSIGLLDILLFSSENSEEVVLSLLLWLLGERLLDLTLLIAVDENLWDILFLFVRAVVVRPPVSITGDLTLLTSKVFYFSLSYLLFSLFIFPSVSIFLLRLYD